MFKYRLKASVSHLTLASRIRAFECAARAPKGSVLHADGSPVLVIDLNILAPYRIEAAGDFKRLVPL